MSRKTDQPGGGEAFSRGPLVRNLNEVLFALNISLAIGYGVLFYYFSRLLGDRGATGYFFDFCYYFLRSAARIKDFLHLPDPVPWNGDPSPISVAVAFLLTAGCASTLLFLFLRLSDRTPVFPILVYTTGAAALFILPAQLIYFNVLTARGIQWDPGFIPSILFSSTGVLIGLISIISQVRILALPASLSLGLLYPTIAGIVLSRANKMQMPESAGVYLSLVYIFLVATPLGWIVWSANKRGHQNLNSGIPARGPLGKSSWICVAVAGAVLVFLWAPRRDYSLMKVKNRESLRIELFHGPCFGSCPVYTITVHGNGEVEYLGQMSVKECGKQSESINESQLMDILRELDQAHFFALEDRAFLWPPDLPSVWVTVKVDGKTKRVGAVTYEARPQNGAMANFVRTASRIDEIVGSPKWTFPKSNCVDRRTTPHSN
jgi:uncharacterized protein DUF6438